MKYIKPKSAGFTYIELLVAATILAILASVALPMVKISVKRKKEIELKRALRKIRTAIDKYKEMCDRRIIPATTPEAMCYPPDLETLVKGVLITGTLNQKMKFLRRIPIDPMTKKAEWGYRSVQDDPDSTSWGGQNVFDVYSLSEGTAIDGTKYKDW